jgi:hypothetical protein
MAPAYGWAPVGLKSETILKSGTVRLPTFDRYKRLCDGVDTEQKTLKRDGAYRWRRPFFTEDNIGRAFEAVYFDLYVPNLLYVRRTVSKAQADLSLGLDAEIEQRFTGNRGECRPGVDESVQLNSIAGLTNERDWMEKSSHALIIPCAQASAVPLT